MGTEPEIVKEHNQRAFDRVAKHLVEQGRASVNIDGECCYRGPGGTSCAVGCLIRDEAYLPSLEGHSFKFVEDNMRPSLSADVNLVESHLLSQLQGAHDHELYCTRFDDWAIQMRRIAEHHDLSTEALDAALAAREKSDDR